MVATQCPPVASEYVFPACPGQGGGFPGFPADSQDGVSANTPAKDESGEGQIRVGEKSSVTDMNSDMNFLSSSHFLFYYLYVFFVVWILRNHQKLSTKRTRLVFSRNLLLVSKRMRYDSGKKTTAKSGTVMPKTHEQGQELPW